MKYCCHAKTQNSLKSRFTLIELLVVIAIIAIASPTFADVVLTNNQLRIALDETGKLVSVAAPDGVNYVDAARPSFLLMVQPYGSGRQPMAPIGLRSAEMGQGRTQLIFSYNEGFSATVEVIKREKYLRLALVEAKPIDQIARITWGPVNTVMKGQFAEYLGLIRENDSTVGMLSLDPNTDGITVDGGHFQVAKYNGADGSRLLAESWDHTREGLGQDGYLAHPILGLTVSGSAIALFGCSRHQELDMIDAVSQSEKLPRPTIGGVWNKRSTFSVAPQIWAHYNQKNLADYLALAKEFGASTICNFGDLWGNWGHFNPNPKVYPEGMSSLRNTVHQCEAAGIGHVMYTLSTFLVKRDLDEPFITPEFNSGFQHLLPAGTLSGPVGEADGSIELKDEPGLAQTINKVNFVCIDGELISRDGVERANGKIVLQGKRGALGTRKTEHQADAKVLCIPQYARGSFCPGTIELQDAVADNLATVARDCGFPQITIDGCESCLRTGHGAYAVNRFASRLYAEIGNPELQMTPSRLGNYDWHLMSYVSWGELDREKGFRGTMLDYRLRRVLQLRSNHMPCKLGQYYPADAKSPEDFEWLMGLAAGWGAGVDLHFTEIDPKDAKLKIYGDIVRRWMEARQAGFFTEQQLLGLRESDRLYNLDRDAGGRFRLDFVRRWTEPGLEILPPSVFRIKPVRAAKIEPCSIDWSWTHNPGIYRKAGVSDDLVAPVNGTDSAWDVRYPAADRLYFVIRVPSNAPCAVRNPTVILNGDTRLVIPVTLQPGQYLSTTHDTSRVSIYASNHEIVAEALIQCVSYHLPAVEAGKPQRLTVSAEAAKPGTTSEIRVNLRTHVPIPSKQNGI